MAEINIYVLQTPRILKNDTCIVLPYKKAEAFLYYLAVEKSATRDQIAALLWDNCDEATAKKNVRHALYTIRKTFDLDLIISSDRQTLRLNPEIDFYIDYDAFTEQKDVQVYEAELLNAFYVKKAYAYEEWITWKRNSVRDKYLKLLEERLRDTENLSVAEAEQLFEKYTKEDPFDEQAYFYIMKKYGNEKLYYKGIRIYQQLAALLNTELRVSPNKEIRQLHKEFLEIWNKEAQDESIAEEKDGHDEEMHKILECYQEFMEGNPQVVLLSGESGTGKTYLAERFLKMAQKNRQIILKAVCLESEQEMKLQPWNILMMQMAREVQENKIKIGDKYLQAADCLFPFFYTKRIREDFLMDTTLPYSYRNVRNLFLSFLVQAAEQMPLILTFDNIQYMDEMSLELLSLVIRTRNRNIMVLLSCQELWSEMQRKYISPLLKEKYIRRIEVLPFTKDEVERIAQKKLGKDAVNQEFIDWLYNECQGNAFFLDVLLNEYAKGTFKSGENSHLTQLLKEQLKELPRETRQVLELIASCQAWADMKSLEHILKRDSIELLNELEELKEKGFISEKQSGGQIQFFFCHESMQKFIHGQMAPSKVRVFHSKLAEYIENLPAYDTSRVERLIYHYDICGNKEKALQYKIQSLAEYAQKYYEMYPMYSNSWSREAFSGTSILEYCDSLEREIMKLYQRENQSDEMVRMYIRLLQTKAQYCIPQGYYEEGIRCVEKALKTNASAGNDLLTKIQCLRFLVYQQINVWKLDKTEQYLKESFQAAEEGGLEEDYAVTCRLYGLYLSMIGKFDESMEYLQKALDFFEGLPLKSRTYALSISACYNYMGETMRKTKRFEEALEYYKKAAAVCTENQYHCNAAVYSNMGCTYMAMGRTEEGVQMLYKADEMYEESFTLVGRAITKAYLTLLEAEKGKEKQARKMFQEARDSARQLDSPYTKGIVYAAAAEAKARFPEMFQDMLKETEESYKQKAIEYLKEIPGAYEIEKFIS